MRDVRRPSAVVVGRYRVRFRTAVRRWGLCDSPPVVYRTVAPESIVASIAYVDFQRMSLW